MFLSIQLIYFEEPPSYTVHVLIGMMDGSALERLRRRSGKTSRQDYCTIPTREHVPIFTYSYCRLRLVVYCLGQLLVSTKSALDICVWSCATAGQELNLLSL